MNSVKKQGSGLLYMLIAGVLLWLFLPERFAVNMPIPMFNSVSKEETLERFTLPPGFEIKLFAEQLNGVRAIIDTEQGDFIISQPAQGQITLVHGDRDNNHQSDGHHILLKGLDAPHGLTLIDNWLYIAETGSLLRIKLDEAQRQVIGAPEYVLKDAFPRGGNHWTRTVKLGPDKKLYISVGSSCNVCEERSKKRASLLQYDLEGNNEVIFAQGLRNTVGFDWHPKTNKLYGVDNGRDHLGDNLPPEEINHIEYGKHYGWPYAYGNNILDQDFSADAVQPANLQGSIYGFTAHSAPLSLKFIRHHPTLQNHALVALHGSWNRSEKSGYRVALVDFSNPNALSEQPFINGFEVNETVTGRPVDIAEDKTGNFYITDDFNGRIYKIIDTHLENQ